jgi:Xaa-Pro dipeptidase
LQREKKGHPEGLQRVRERLAEHQLQAVVLCSPENFYYVSGVRLLMQRLIRASRTYTVITPDDATLLTAASDVDHARRDGSIEEVQGYAVGVSPVEHLMSLLEEKGLGSARVGLDSGYFSADELWVLEEALPSLELLSARELMNEVRMVKTEAEIDRLWRAERLTETAINAAFASTELGDTEVDIARRIAAKMMERDAETVDFVLLAAGENSTKYHFPPSDHVVQPGEVIHLDCGGSFYSYRSDLSRNVGMGELSAQQKETYARLWHVQRKVIDGLRPGRIVADVCREYVRLMEEAGLEPPSPYLGHGIGLDSHEFPELTSDCQVELRAGMVLAIEPNTFVPGDARYDIEDTVVITGDGCDMLSGHRHSEELRILG